MFWIILVVALIIAWGVRKAMIANRLAEFYKSHRFSPDVAYEGYGNTGIAAETDTGRLVVYKGMDMRLLDERDVIEWKWGRHDRNFYHLTITVRDAKQPISKIWFKSKSKVETWGNRLTAMYN